MDDLISRQAAIDAIKEYFARIGKLKRRGLTKGEKAISLDTAGAIETLPSAQPEQQWIPCSERLPNCNGIYIVTRIMSDGFECRNIVDACYFDGFDTWHDDTRVNHERKYLTDVVAWCELPEPWRGEEHETSGHIQGT